jgi:hypothetical protein
VTGIPQPHIDGVENSQECETPVNSINYNLLPFRGKLIDDGTQKEEVDQRPGSELIEERWTNAYVQTR